MNTASRIVRQPKDEATAARTRWVERNHVLGRAHSAAMSAPCVESELDAPRMGGIALKNGLILVTERHWAVAIRENNGTINVASGTKARLPGSGENRESYDAPGADPHPSGRAGMLRSRGIPVLRGLERFGETLLVLGQVKRYLPQAQLPLQGGRVALALAGSLVATEAVKAANSKSALVEELGIAAAGFLPAMLALKGSAVSGYHGAEHKVIGGREAALRAATNEGASREEAERAIVTGDSASATKEHERCGSNIIGPYLLATVATNLIARRSGAAKPPAVSAIASMASLGLALEALRWSSRHGDTLVARLMMTPGHLVQKRLTTSEPSGAQLEVGERALSELMRVENAAG